MCVWPPMWGCFNKLISQTLITVPVQIMSNTCTRGTRNEIVVGRGRPELLLYVQSGQCLYM